MRIALLISLTMIMNSCQSPLGDSSRSATTQTVQDNRPKNSEIRESNNWVPVGIEKCLSQVNSTGYPVTPDYDVNPYYLRVNLDGNGIADIAVMVHDAKNGKTALVVCRDVEPPFNSIRASLLGKYQESDNVLSNVVIYIEEGWEIASVSETNQALARHFQGRPSSDSRSAGESIMLIHEGSEPRYIYWYRNRFHLLED